MWWARRLLLGAIGIIALVNVSLVSQIADGGDHFWANHLAPVFTSANGPPHHLPLPKSIPGGIVENEREANDPLSYSNIIEQPSKSKKVASAPEGDAKKTNNDNEKEAKDPSSGSSESSPEKETKKANDKNNNQHQIAGLSCDKFGGPLDKEAIEEMVYWRDIPSDASFKSPLASTDESNKKYFTFEPDSSGFNNVRMAMETAVTLAFATGRILVLPPKLNMHQLESVKEKEATNSFSLEDFFHFASLSAEHRGGVEIISMEDFLKTEALAGNLKNKTTGLVSFPPNNQTNWDTTERSKYSPFWPWLRDVTKMSEFSMRKCIVGIPSTPGKAGADRMLEHFIEAKATFSDDEDRIAKYTDNPTEVDASPAERMPELLFNKKGICVYDEKLQDAKVFHIVQDSEIMDKILIHFYAFVFFEDWHDDLWTKRFVRDHLRYRDEIQCAAARVVQAVRNKARENGNPDGEFDTFHVRRGDFKDAYEMSMMEADEIIENTANVLEENSTIFIATDERDKSFFDPFRKLYNIYFLDDFMHLVPDISTAHYGLLDQRVASRGETFIGTYHSTFTGYINRMRGYHSQKDKLTGYQKGIISSYYYAPHHNKRDMRHYSPIVGPVWAREFPLGKHYLLFESKTCISIVLLFVVLTRVRSALRYSLAWRDIDHDLMPNQILS